MAHWRAAIPSAAWFQRVVSSSKQSPRRRATSLRFAAGSGITPVLSQIKEVLRNEPSSVFTLFYVNRDTPSIIFREALQELKDEYLERFRLFHILTREPQDIELFNGRLNEERCAAILASDWVDVQSLDAAFLCGPEEMIWACKAALEGAGMASDRVKFELFTSSAGAKKEQTQTAAEGDSSTKRLSIVMDGMTTVVDVAEGKSVLDAALDAAWMRHTVAWAASAVRAAPKWSAVKPRWMSITRSSRMRSRPVSS